MPEVTFTHLSNTTVAPKRDGDKWELYACLEAGPVTLEPKEKRYIPLGVAANIPEKLTGVVIGSDSLDNALRDDESAYRTYGHMSHGQLTILLECIGSEACVVNHGDNVATLVVTG